MPKAPFVYIVTNRLNTVIYIGVTSNLLQRIAQHRAGALDGFTKNINALNSFILKLMTI